MHADARKLLWDARRAAERVAKFTRGKTFAEYQADDLLRPGVERQLAIAGEALNQLRRIDTATAGAIPELRRIAAKKLQEWFDDRWRDDLPFENLRRRHARI
jgi:uncharacterized protein with HEPN domain